MDGSGKCNSATQSNVFDAIWNVLLFSKLSKKYIPGLLYKDEKCGVGCLLGCRWLLFTCVLPGLMLQQY